MEGKVGYLGPEGTYSEIAAERLCPESSAQPYGSFPQLLKALSEGGIDCAVLPIENTVNGAVTQNLDLLQEAQGVYAVRACSVAIDHRLVTLKGADRSKIRRIYSHAQALGQCSAFLSRNFPDAALLQSPSTSGCFDLIRSEEEAGIVGAQCAREGYELSPQSISDDKNNYTLFLLAVKRRPEEDTQSDRVFFSVTCRHEVGALLKMLNILADNGINMTKIESRPIKDRMGEFRFFIETEGNFADRAVKQALKEVERSASSFKFLGCYSTDLPKGKQA